MIKNPTITNIDDEFNKAVNEAERLYFDGKIFIYPTDTLYGIGGNPFDESVVSRINRIKRRNEFKQFILLTNNLVNLKSYVEIVSADHLKAIKKFWPGPVSAVFKANPDFFSEIGVSTVAFRIPDNQFCLTLLKRIGKPLISTSVNKTDEKPLLDFSEIGNKFGQDVDAIFYSKSEKIAVSSTIIDLTGKEPKLIREGKIKFVDLLRKFN